MKVVKNNQNLKLITVFGYNALKNENERAYTSENSYTIYYDIKTNAVYKAGVIEIHMNTVLSLSLIAYPIMVYFPDKIIPYDNLLLFCILTLSIILISLKLGNFLSRHSNKNLRRIELTKEEWTYYVSEGKRNFKSESILLIFLTLLMFICFILLYVSTSKWWFFGGIISAILVGVAMPFISISRYLLYKNKITPELMRGDSEDETITHW